MRRSDLRLALVVGFLVGLTLPACSSGPTSAPRAVNPRAPQSQSPATSKPLTFAVIGDYGSGNSDEVSVEKLVASWKPAFVITTGDDYYASAGGTGAGKYVNSTGRFYRSWLKDVGAPPSGEASKNAFFPVLGNEDYAEGTPAPETYLAYFDLPGAGFANTSGNERYYDFVEGPVHFFALNSNPEEPDGTSVTSKQAAWLHTQLAASTSRWNVVYDHHPPFSSDSVHGSTDYMQWPFSAWHADAVLSGHAHVYERIVRDGIVYFINGLGGAMRYDFKNAVAGSTSRYRADWGAQRVSVTDTSMTFEFYTVSGAVIDRFTLSKR